MGVVMYRFLPGAILAVLLATPALPLHDDDFDRGRHSFDVVEATIPELQQALQSGVIDSKELVKLYLRRIRAFEDEINAYITVNPRAMRDAAQLDRERAHGQVRGPLHGIPIALKDIIQTRDLPTTGGAVAFDGFVPVRDATLTRKLREAGAIILGKTVLSEWANWTSDRAPNNYSGVGGFAYNPYDPREDPRFDDGRPVLDTGGSSSGAATAASMAAANVGTETSGSILSPSNRNMLVGIKPTVGLISRAGIAPISAEQDTAGPMARDVASAAILLGAMTGVDPLDPATGVCPVISDYTPFLDPNGLDGARIGLPREFYFTNRTPEQQALVLEAIAELEGAGAEVEDVVIPSLAEYLAFPPCANGTQTRDNDDDCSIVLKYAFKRDWNAWLDALEPPHPPHPGHRGFRGKHGRDGGHRGRALGRRRPPVDSLTELIAFNENTPGAIMFGQARLLISEDVDLVLDGPRFFEDRARDLDLTKTRGLDPALAGPDGIHGTDDDFDALLFPGRFGADIAARPGYPSVTVPFGFVPNDGGDPFPPGFDPKPEPFGMTFTGPACSEPSLIRLAFAFEQLRPRRVPPESTPPLPDRKRGRRR